MTAGTYNITIEQGATYNLNLALYTDSAKTTPKDLTGYTAKKQLRSTKSDPDSLLTLTTGGGGITIGGTSTNEIQIAVSATQTASMNFKTALYDLELTTGATISRLVEGTVTLSKEVTR